MPNKTPVYLVFGPQGSGKSTQAEFLAEYLTLPFFDSGKELRELVASGTKEAELVREIMRSGKLVPNDTLRQIFDRFIQTHDCSKGLVTDGFPRNITQVKLFEELAKDHSWEVIGYYIAISDQTAKNRLATRHTIIDGRKVIREDDQPAVVEKRLALFRQETLPVIDWLRKNYRVIEIDGEPDRQIVFEQIKKSING